MQTQAPRHPQTVLLTLFAMASPLALNAFVPAMPAVARELQVDIGTVQLSYTLYLFTLAFSQLICGPLADHFGRRPLLLSGLGLLTFGSLLPIAWSNVGALILGRVLQALGGGMAMVLARTIILDSHGRSGAARPMGYIVMAIAIAQSIAPALGGFLNQWWNWQAIFGVSSIMGFLTWLVAFFQLPETCPARDDRLRLAPVLQHYAGLAQSARYTGYVLSTTAIAAAFYMFVGTAPYIVDQLGGNSAEFGLWFLPVSLSFMAGSFASTRLSRRIRIDQAILVGHSLSLAGGILLVASAATGSLTVARLFIPMSLVTFGRGLSQPSTQSAAIGCAPGASATASGMMGFIQLLTGAAIAQLMPFTLHHGSLLVTSCIGLMPVIAFAALCRATRSPAIIGA